MFDSFYTEIELVFMVFSVAAVFIPSVGEDSQERDMCSSKKGTTQSFSRYAATRSFFLS